MTWFKNISLDESSGTQKAVLALGAFAVAGIAAVQLQRMVRHLREEHLRFNFPIEEDLFIGWGGGNPRRGLSR